MRSSFYHYLLIALFCLAPMANAMDLGVGWAGKSGMANRVFQGFEKGIKELAPQINLEVKKELGSMDDLAQVVKAWEKEKTGMVLLRSNAAKWLGNYKPAIPTFIGGCNNPEQLGTIQNLAAPEGKITGVTYYLQPEVQFSVFQSILPDMKSVLLLLGKGNPSAVVDLQGTRRACQDLGLGFREVQCETVDDALAAVRSVNDATTAVVIGNQSLVMDSADQLVSAAGSTPVVAYSDRAVKMGALAGFVADDAKLGYLLAETVVAVMVSGKPTASVPVKFDEDPKFFVNIKTAEKLGVELPYAILQAATIIE